MPLLRSLSLRQLLTLPYVVLVMLLAVVLGTLSYGAARGAVDNLSDQLLVETAARISQAVEHHISGSSAVLETAFPKGVLAPDRIGDELEALRTRFWLATSVHRALNNYAYYGDEHGHFFGLWRNTDDDAQLRLRLAESGSRTIYRFQGIHGPLLEPTPENRNFDPRQRPWYRAASASATEVWTPIYIDFRSSELVATRARKVTDANGALKGVVATDISLKQLSSFTRALPLSRNGLAFIVELDGNLIATSRGEHIRRGQDGSHARLNAADSSDPLLAATYRGVQALMKQPDASSQPRARKIELSDGSAVQVAYTRIRDAAGLEWVIAVAVPRSDFLQQITTNLYQTLLFSLLAAGAVVVVGLFSLSVVSRDLRKLAVAARQVGDGDFDTPLKIDRSDEIGDLAQSFSTMKHKLSTDRLTGLSNREALMRRVEDRILLQRRGTDPRPFVLLFLDVDGFKTINDRFGHDAGDRVLRELGERMLAALRARDMVARWAGDEFLVMLDTVENAGDGLAVSAKLHEAFLKPLVCLPPGSEVSLGVSIGMATYPDDAQDVDTLVQRADEDMYRRKRGAG